MFDYIGKLIY